MAARKRKIRHDEETRAKIKASQIINRLMAGLEGTVELSGPQVSIGLGLLKKVLPDLTDNKHTGDDEHPIAHVFRWKSSKPSK